MRSSDFGAIVTPAYAGRDLRSRRGGLARFAGGGPVIKALINSERRLAPAVTQGQMQRLQALQPDQMRRLADEYSAIGLTSDRGWTAEDIKALLQDPRTNAGRINELHDLGSGPLLRMFPRKARGGSIRTVSEIKNSMMEPRRSQSEFSMVPMGGMAQGGSPSDVWTEIDQILNPPVHHFGDGGIVEAILRNRLLQRSGRTVGEMTRDESGLRHGEVRIPTGGRAGSITRRVSPEGDYIPGSTEADDQFRAQQHEIYDMAARRRRYSDGGNVSPLESRRAMKMGYLPHAAGFPHMAGGGLMLDEIPDLTESEMRRGRPEYAMPLFRSSRQAWPYSNDDERMARIEHPEEAAGFDMRARHLRDRGGDIMGTRGSALKDSMLRRGWGVPDHAMEPEQAGGDFLASMLYPGDWPLWSNRIMSLGKQGAMMGADLVSGMMGGNTTPMREAGTEESAPRDWRWSASNARSQALLREIADRLPRMSSYGRR